MKAAMRCAPAARRWRMAPPWTVARNARGLFCEIVMSDVGCSRNGRGGAHSLCANGERTRRVYPPSRSEGLAGGYTLRHVVPLGPPDDGDGDAHRSAHADECQIARIGAAAIAPCPQAGSFPPAGPGSDCAFARRTEHEQSERRQRLRGSQPPSGSKTDHQRHFAGSPPEGTGGQGRRRRPAMKALPLKL